MLNTDDASLAEVDEALAHIANARRSTTKDCRLRELVSEDIDPLLDRRFVWEPVTLAQLLARREGRVPMHQRVVP